MEKEERDTHVVYEKDTFSSVKIADEVIAIIAGISATEVEGVDSMVGGFKGDIISKMGGKNLARGVKVEVFDSQVSVDLTLNIKYGYSIPQVCQKVQEKVSQAVENMTGLGVLDVNIKIAGVNTDDEKN